MALRRRTRERPFTSSATVPWPIEKTWKPPESVTIGRAPAHELVQAAERAGSARGRDRGTGGTCCPGRCRSPAPRPRPASARAPSPSSPAGRTRACGPRRGRCCRTPGAGARSPASRAMNFERRHGPAIVCSTGARHARGRRRHVGLPARCSSLIAVESMGVPLPGETALFAAAIFAAQGQAADRGRDRGRRGRRDPRRQRRLPDRPQGRPAAARGARARSSATAAR